MEIRTTAQKKVTAQKVEKVESLRKFVAAHESRPWKRIDPIELMTQQREDVKNPSEIKEPDLMPVIGQSYPPSTRKKLNQMKISDLRTETRHVGKALWVRRVGPLNLTYDGVFFLVQDAEKNVELVHWTTANLMTDTSSMIPSHQALLIKEPYYVHRTEKQLVIRVEHATDIDFHDGNEDYKIEDLLPYGTLSLQLMDAGKHFRYTGYTSKAVDLFTAAIKQSHPNDLFLKRELWIERAIAYAHLGKYAQSRADLANDISISPDEHARHQTSYAFFECCAAKYSLGDYEGAAADMAQAGPIHPSSREIFQLRDKIEARHREAKEGKYDFDVILSNWSVQRPWLEIADHISSKIKTSPNARKGVGLVATGTILPGELIICEKAIACIFPHVEPSKPIEQYDTRDNEIKTTQSGLCFKVIDHLLKRPKKVHQLREVFDSLEKGLIGENKTINTFKVHDLLSNHGGIMPKPHEDQNYILSGFADDDHGPDPEKCTSGLWLQSARLGHSCVPNAVKVHVGDVAIVRAYRPIEAGEEITIAYVDNKQSLAARSEQLQTRYGIECVCERCATEIEDQFQATGTDRITKRLKDYIGLVSTVEKYPLYPNDAPPPEDVFLAAKVLADRLEKSYEMDIYEDNYCFAAAPAVLWLAKAHRLREEHDEFLVAVCKFFKLCGYETTTIDSRNGVQFVPSEASWVPFQAVKLLSDAAYVLFFVQKERKMGMQMEKVAKELYVIMNGVEAGWVGLSDMVKAAMAD